MRLRSVGVIAAALGGLLALLAGLQETAAQSARKAVILSINDVYRIEGIEDGRSGGMGRVLRAELERVTPDLLFLHAGDFLGPSFLTRTYGGADMIDVMNIMDGKPQSGVFDRRMFVVFGNHEFDQSHCGRDGPLARLVAASEFTWLGSNLDFGRCERLRALASIPNIATSRIVGSGGLKIGLYSATLAYPEYAAVVLDPLATSCAQVEALRAKGVDVVVALTHQSWRTDLAMLGRGVDGRELPAGERRCMHAPDLVIGGHDHFNMALPSAQPRLFKADADAASAWVIEIEKSAGRPLRIKSRLVQLNERRPLDPFTQRIANHWLRQHDERFCLNECVGPQGEAAKTCRAAVEGGACLKETYARAASPIETEEINIRSFEIGFGNWLADQVRDAGKADVAFLNAGAIRINQNLPAGTMLGRRHLEQMFPFRDKLVLREVTGAALWRAMEHAVEQRGEGPWAHFSGMAVALAEVRSPGRIARILVRRQTGAVVEISPASAELFKVAASPFVLADGDGHGFGLCAKEVARSTCIGDLEAAPGWPVAGEGGDIASLVRQRLRALDPARGLELTVDRRLCERAAKGECLIDRWQK